MTSETYHPTGLTLRIKARTDPAKRTERGRLRRNLSPRWKNSTLWFQKSFLLACSVVTSVMKWSLSALTSALTPKPSEARLWGTSKTCPTKCNRWPSYAMKLSILQNLNRRNLKHTRLKWSRSPASSLIFSSNLRWSINSRNQWRRISIRDKKIEIFE